VAFEFDFAEMFRHAALYLSKGLGLVRLHGFYPDGRCTCGAPDCRVGGARQRSAGKHPVSADWGKNYAKNEDDLLAWDDGVPFNIGVILGPSSGVIDCEDDTPEGKAFRETLGLDKIDTPSWTSGRSTHQMFQWDEKFSTISKAEPGGLECRVGGGGAQIQSVMPPSWHWSGVRYAWKPGQALDDIDPAPVPRDLAVQIVNYQDGRRSAGGGKEANTPLIFAPVHDGEGRHRRFLMWSWSKIVSDRFPLAPERRAILTQELLDANEKYLVPPKSKPEALQIINSCFEHYRRKEEKSWRPSPNDVTTEGVEAEIATIKDDEVDTAVPVSGGFDAHGLERYQVGNATGWKPGSWSIQMIHGDPPAVILCVPAWSKTPCKGRIHLSFEEFSSAAKVGQAIFLATRRVILHGDMRRWTECWSGIDACKKTNWISVPGVMEQLVQRKNSEDDIQVGASGLRYAQLAGYVLHAIRKANRPRNEDKPEPNESGLPCWVTPEELWLQWGKLWETISTGHPDVTPGDRLKFRSRLLDAVGASDFNHKRHRFPHGRLSYAVFDKRWIDVIEALSNGEGV
jgi:hypothetical protein